MTTGDSQRLVQVIRERAAVLELRLDRPAIRNALDPSMIDEIASALALVPGDVTIRAVLLTASGSDFCAGADLRWMQSLTAMTPDGAVEASRPLQELLDEPASGMSRAERQQIPGWIAQLQSNRQCAVVWIEHDIELLTSSAHAVYVLHHGEVTASGRPRDREGDRERVIDAYFGRKHEPHARVT